MTRKQVKEYVNRIYPDLPIRFDNDSPDNNWLAYIYINDLGTRQLQAISHLAINPRVLDRQDIPDTDIMDYLHHEMMHVQMFIDPHCDGQEYRDTEEWFELRTRFTKECMRLNIPLSYGHTNIEKIVLGGM